LNNMKKLVVSALSAALLITGATLAFAQTDGEATSSSEALSKLTYPIADLGNCDSREACKLYCDTSSHRDACFAYAQKAGLMTKEKIDTAKLVLSKKGPGSCGSRQECVSYCADSSHQDECLSFAQEHNVIASSTAMLIKRLNSGEGPGACKSAETCKMYCEDSSHQAECRNFAEENSLIPKMMGSTTGMRLPRMGTSTSDDAHTILASTTPGRDRGIELHDRAGSTTPAGLKQGEPPRKVSSSTPPSSGPGATEPKKIPPQNNPPSPSALPGTGNNDDLGASVMRGFVKLLGF
jgi:hypothetical protein